MQFRFLLLAIAAFACATLAAESDAVQGGGANPALRGNGNEEICQNCFWHPEQICCGLRP
ncbi:hypothetical protein SDRG_00927 [Saprolegnia diclina VS20]|uniref:Uncharacterized protein n=1 Tax=Saprolegnia diclina (strain VS20) TaxID=1156394 RepID=T0R557_SAPDV|nr:hypothetical protein SDRG_00927 [Saprolegnia diclina VS20]EQC42086.1 hypothetical protein SDRG_00927 [Saprolegnia diclina VS20]|eukprot:XP_008604655.1 hypothetical protein SDRG_00927 [Saprolegnia diclina VS20]